MTRIMSRVRCPGTTTETALAFRLLKKQCEDQRGKDMAKKVIVAITDAKKGAPMATNIATAEVLIHGLERGDLDWRDIVHPQN